MLHALDRGKGLAAAEKERALASGGELRGGSNVGKGQMKAADYVLVPDIVNKNANSGGKNIGGILGGMLGGVAGAAVGGISLKSKTADVVLTMTDVRSTEQVALAQGHAKKTDLGWGAGGAAFFGGFAAGGASSYANTEIGQVVAMAYLDAFAKLVARSRPSAQRQGGQRHAVRDMAKPGRMYDKPDIKAKVVRDLDPGMMLYPTGEKEGIWWKVSDELGTRAGCPPPCSTSPSSLDPEEAPTTRSPRLATGVSFRRPGTWLAWSGAPKSARRPEPAATALPLRRFILPFEETSRWIHPRISPDGRKKLWKVLAGYGRPAGRAARQG